MRRLFLSIFTLGFFLGMLTGCQNFFCHTAGVCDCDNDDDPCTHRAPWACRYVGSPVPVNGLAANGTSGNSSTGAVPAQPVSRTK